MSTPLSIVPNPPKSLLTGRGWFEVYVALNSLGGPALMAMWSKAMPLTASCLSDVSGFESHRDHVRKLPRDLRLGGGFDQVLRFPSPVTTG